MGLNRPQKEMLTTSVTPDLFNGVWNIIITHLAFTDSNELAIEVKPTSLAADLAIGFFRYPLTRLPAGVNGQVAWLHTELVRSVCEGQWSLLYDFLEHIAASWERIAHKSSYDEFELHLNDLFEAEFVGYRLIRRQILPITDKTEAAAVNAAQVAAEESGYDSVATHLCGSAKSLSDRPRPDYRNCIKEAIAAVESAAGLLTGQRRTDLAKALAALEKSGKLHPRLKSAYTALYEYASDSGGIRHGMLQESKELDFALAKYMLVSCSAFVHYLLEEAKER
jgi:hypothetical protein